MRGDGIPSETGANPHETYRAGALVSLLRLHWFIRLRWVITAAALVALVLERAWTPSVTRPEGLWWVVGTLGVVNVGWMVLSRIFALRLRATPVDEVDAVRTARFFANAQVAIDLLLLTLVLRFTGGVESPMAMFYVFHMAIGSLLLPRFQAVAQGVWATLLYAGLGVGEWRGWIAPHFEFLPWLTCVGYSHQMEYVAIAVAVVGCGVFGTLFFTLRVVGRLDDRERHLRTTLAALRQSQIAVQDIQARRSRFMQTAAHQLKSPLAAIQTLSNLIRDGIVKDGAILETCEKIGRRCRAGIAAVTELLTLARVQDAAPERHVSALSDVGVAVREVCSRREPEARQAGIEFSWTALAEGEFRARVDQADLVDCLDNLVENAIKYTPKGGRIVVAVERRFVNGGEDAGSQPARAFVAVTVEDTGIGIDPADLESSDGVASVFDAYRRGHQAMAAGIPGSGLGLSIVRVVVEQAGGRIQVRSRPQGGTRFAVMFPAETALPEGLAVRDTRNREIIVETARGDNEAAPRQTVEDRNHAG